MLGEQLAMSAETTLQRFEDCDLNSPKSLLRSQLLQALPSASVFTSPHFLRFPIGETEAQVW